MGEAINVYSSLRCPININDWTKPAFDFSQNEIQYPGTVTL